MADILIRGMEMPKEGFAEVLIKSDGTVIQTGQSKRFNGRDYYTPYKGAIPVLFKAISVPPHGRLIDANELVKPKNQHIDVHSDEWYVEVRTIDSAPTIIPASKEE